MKAYQRKAPAKINLTLDILRRREDGFHDLEMVMQTVSLYDTVTIRHGTGSGVIRVTSDSPQLPDGPKNLAYRAAEVFFLDTGLPVDGLEIELEKHIPECAGLAGGSSDAAAVLLALRELYSPALERETLERMGEQIGSDVPFCVRGGTARAEGRGEQLTTLASMPLCHIVLCKPDFDLPTPALFGRVRVPEICSRPNLTAMESALVQRDLSGVAGAVGNVFEEVLTEPERREIHGIRDSMIRSGALGAAMTGSGPTVFGIFEEESMAATAARTLQNRYKETFLVKPCEN